MFSKLCQLSFYKTCMGRICWSNTGFMRRGSDVLVCFLFSTLSTDPIISDRKLKQTIKDRHCNTINSHFKQVLITMCFPPKSESNCQPVCASKNGKECFTPTERSLEDPGCCAQACPRCALRAELKPPQLSFYHYQGATGI